MNRKSMAKKYIIDVMKDIEKMVQEEMSKKKEDSERFQGIKASELDHDCHLSSEDSCSVCSAEFSGRDFYQDDPYGEVARDNVNAL